MNFSVPFSFSVALLTAGFMQRAAASRFHSEKAEKDALFSTVSSYVCFALALAAAAAAVFSQ